MDQGTSEVVEEYLLEIYILNQAGEKVKANKLATSLNTKPPTVFATIQRMKRDGLIKINRSKEISFTPKGSLLADNIAFRHNLAEYFLCNSFSVSSYLSVAKTLSTSSGFSVLILLFMFWVMPILYISLLRIR